MSKNQEKLFTWRTSLKCLNRFQLTLQIHHPNLGPINIREYLGFIHARGGRYQSHVLPSAYPNWHLFWLPLKYEQRTWPTLQEAVDWVESFTLSSARFNRDKLPLPALLHHSRSLKIETITPKAIPAE